MTDRRFSGHVSELRDGDRADDDLRLALKHAPVLMLDRAEPFRPVAIGCSVISEVGKSPSSKFVIEPAGRHVIEYAIFWDHDIQHLYDLEHVWIHVDEANRVVKVEASRHGRRVKVEPRMAAAADRIALWVEPGKHALFAAAAELLERRPDTDADCTVAAGREGVHMGNPFAADFGDVSALDHRLARLFLRRLAFEPRYGHAVSFDCRDAHVVPWEVLASWIPARVRHLVDHLRCTPHIKAVFLDCGDTLVDEGSEVKAPDGDIAVSGDLLPHARPTLDALRDNGYALALVADGPRATFQNLLGQHDLWSRFASHTISGDVGALKPDRRMFETAMSAMRLGSADAGRVVMVGNNLERDIAGANAAGHVSVFFKWSDRRRVEPQSDGEQPDHVIHSLRQLLPTLEKIELGLT